MKSRIYKFNPTIYPFPVLITKKFDCNEMEERFWSINSDEQRVACTDEFRTNGNVAARVLCLADKKTNNMYYMIVIFQPAATRHGIITHECIHLINAYLQYLGVSSPKAYEDEQYAYFGGWLANCMWSVLNGTPAIMNGIVFE